MTCFSAHSNSNAYNFDEVCDETLDSLSEYFEQIVESCEHLDSADVGFSVRYHI